MVTKRSLISADNHVFEPVTLWQERLARGFRERGPRVEQRGEWIVMAIEKLSVGFQSFRATRLGGSFEELTRSRGVTLALHLRRANAEIIGDKRHAEAYNRDKYLYEGLHAVFHPFPLANQCSIRQAGSA